MSSNFEAFLKWFSDNPTFMSIGEYYDGDELPDISFLNLLGLEKDNLKAFTLDAIEVLESNQSANELKGGFRAYSQFQDLFGISLQDDSPLWNRHYCYFESLVYLRESIVAWLDQNVLAALVLLRPFLELSILHLYWYLRCEHNDYAEFYLWLDNKKDKPPFRNQIEFVFSHLPTKDAVQSERLKNIQHIIYNAYKFMSTYNHTPKIDESIISLGGGAGKVSMFTFFLYLANINILLRQLVYLYILAYPMSLFPVDRYNKWGYGGPLGLFFDLANISVMKHYLGIENVEKLRNYFLDLEEVKTLLNWFDSQTDFSESELESSWQEFAKDKNLKNNPQIKEQRIAMYKAHSRGIVWFTNYLHAPPKLNEDMSDEMLEKIMKQVINW